MPPLTEQECVDLVTEIAVDYAPRRFALGAVTPDFQSGGIFAWGIEFGDEVAVAPLGGSSVSRMSSAERAQRIYSKLGDVRLIWIDDAPEPEPDDDADDADEPVSVPA